MNALTIIRTTERLYTLTKRAAVSDDRDTRRADIVARFRDMCTALGKIAMPKLSRDWMAVHEAVVHLHTEAVQADERRMATFAHAGSEAALVTSLHALAAVLGFTLADAATAAEDDAAQAAVEGEKLEAAE